MELSLRNWYRILSPRPTVLVTTVNAKGQVNTAPFSFVMPVSFEPPMVAFASQHAHDTTRNILETKDFVLSIPGYDILNKMWLCAKKFPYGVSEIDKARLTVRKSLKIKSPGIEECFGNFECELFSTQNVGDHNLFVGKILRADIKDNLLDDDKFLVTKANPLMHISGVEFALVGEIVNPG